MTDKKYAVVRELSQFVITYVVPMDKLQEMNPNAEVKAEWLADTVICHEADEFSQRHLGGTILDIGEIAEEEMLELFDKENDYLSSWTTEQKIAWVKDLLTENKE